MKKSIKKNFTVLEALYDEVGGFTEEQLFMYNNLFESLDVKDEDEESEDDSRKDSEEEYVLEYIFRDLDKKQLRYHPMIGYDPYNTLYKIDTSPETPISFIGQALDENSERSEVEFQSFKISRKIAEAIGSQMSANFLIAEGYVSIKGITSPIVHSWLYDMDNRMIIEPLLSRYFSSLELTFFPGCYIPEVTYCFLEKGCVKGNQPLYPTLKSQAFNPVTKMKKALVEALKFIDEEGDQESSSANKRRKSKLTWLDDHAISLAQAAKFYPTLFNK